MNAKKAKAIRRLAKEEGKYSTEPDYRVMNTKKKVIYGKDANGKQTVQEVDRTTIANLSKIYYRRMKQAYKNGEFTI